MNITSGIGTFVVAVKTKDTNTYLVEHYMELLNNLSNDSKLELIARLARSMKTGKKADSVPLADLYGSFISDQSADELVDDLKKARVFNRKRAGR